MEKNASVGWTAIAKSIVNVMPIVHLASVTMVR